MKHLTFAFFLMIVSGMLFSSCERSNTPVDNPTDENADELTKDAIIIGTGDEPGVSSGKRPRCSGMHYHRQIC